MPSRRKSPSVLRTTGRVLMGIGLFVVALIALPIVMAILSTITAILLGTFLSALLFVFTLGLIVASVIVLMFVVQALTGEDEGEQDDR